MQLVDNDSFLDNKCENKNAQKLHSHPFNQHNKEIEMKAETNSQLVRVEREASIFSIGGIWLYSFTSLASPAFSPVFSS